MVHQPIPIPEAMKILKAKEAVDAEWTKLANKRAWDLESVRGRQDVKDEAIKQGKATHFGGLMDMCHRKHAELAEKFHVYKGRVCFRGDQVRDEEGFYAVFSEQGTSASRQEAAKMMDAIGRMPDHHGEDSDARSAYTQVVFENEKEIDFVETWVSLPRNRRPPSWDKYKDPVCKLRVNLYGHPLAGLYWEKFCHRAVTSCGFERVKGWECLYVHRSDRIFLSIYVDDFKMAGLKKNIPGMWKKLSSKLDLDPPVPFDGNVYLGCRQNSFTPLESEIKKRCDKMQSLLARKGPADLQQQQGDTEFPPLKDSKPKDIGVKPTKSKAKKKAKENGVKPPHSSPGSKAATSSASSPVKAYYYDMCGHAESCVERYCELANKSIQALKWVPTPCLDDHLLAPEDFVTKGSLSHLCARIVLKALYLACIGRPDLLWTVNYLAREVTRWNVACDKRLHRLISFIHHTKHHVLTNFVGDKPEDCILVLFPDASFAGDLADSKSTTGAILCLIGPRTFVTLCWICKKPGAVSHSSTEAEVISLDTTTRLERHPLPLFIGVSN